MKRQWYTMAMVSGRPGEAIIDIMDEIGYFGVSAQNFADDLNALGEIRNLTVRINSLGGHVFDAVAIYTMLDMHPADVRIEILGIAASAASFIAMAGDVIAIADNAFMMIHGPSTIALGDEKEMRNALGMLEKVRRNMVRIYSKRTGIDSDEIDEMLAGEHWFSADEAVAKGFADETFGAQKVTASFEGRTISSIPTAAAHLFAQHNEEEPSMGTQTKPGAETPEQMEARLREEIMAKIAADAAEVEAKAKADADALAAANASTAKTEDQIRAEFAQIADACALAGHPEKASEYLAQKLSLTAVMADLKKVVAAGAGGNDEATSTANAGPVAGANGRTNHLGVDTSKGLNVDGAYAKFNARQ